jgi:hypothetical protein
MAGYILRLDGSFFSQTAFRNGMGVYVVGFVGKCEGKSKEVRGKFLSLVFEQWFGKLIFTMMVGLRYGFFLYGIPFFLSLFFWSRQKGRVMEG